ncbi:hypothetical protein C8Q73DRAFT_678883 [Cubamyces lactineus]|nr:hypothetical protein C8Q73DRAFT_678883 [Cubamyces lactineus]
MDAYYALSRSLPRGANMVWGINLGADNMTNAANVAGAIVRAFDSPVVRASGVALHRLEVWNEPDIYTFTGLRTRGWTPEMYIEQWMASAGAVAQVAGIRGRDGPITFQGASCGTQQLIPLEVFDLGLLNIVPGRAISVCVFGPAPFKLSIIQISQHRYSVISLCNGTVVLLDDLINKETVRIALLVIDPLE